MVKEGVFFCPFCGVAVPTFPGSCRNMDLSFNFLGDDDFPSSYHFQTPSEDPYSIRVFFYYCPSCKQISISAEGGQTELKGKKFQIYPKAACKPFPEYVPEQIRSDYEEACAIMYLSPKASATLARRCLQGIIRNFWGIKKSSLAKEIDAIKNRVPQDLYEAFNEVRRIGNIAAHMEKDVNLIVDIEPHEAELLLKLIETLVEEWYVRRHGRENLLTSLKDLDERIQNQRKQKPQNA